MEECSRYLSRYGASPGPSRGHVSRSYCPPALEYARGGNVAGEGCRICHGQRAWVLLRRVTPTGPGTVK